MTVLEEQRFINKEATGGDEQLSAATQERQQDAQQRGPREERETTWGDKNLFDISETMSGR